MLSSMTSVLHIDVFPLYHEALYASHVLIGKDQLERTVFLHNLGDCNPYTPRACYSQERIP